MIQWLTATGDSGNPSWPGMFLEATERDELGSGGLTEPTRGGCRLPIRSLRIMARLLCPDELESVVMIGANRVFVRDLRRQRVATYFRCWRALGRQVEEHLNNRRASGTRPAALTKRIRRGLAAYHMTRLAISGAAYCLGARVNPAPSLERITQLLGDATSNPE